MFGIMVKAPSRNKEAMTSSPVLKTKSHLGDLGSLSAPGKRQRKTLPKNFAKKVLQGLVQAIVRIQH